MAKKIRYNLYDNGKLVLEDATHLDIARAIGCNSIKISNYIKSNSRYKKRYTFEYSDEREQQVTPQERLFIQRWEEVVKPFKNVIWVKEGGRKLRVGMS